MEDEEHRGAAAEILELAEAAPRLRQLVFWSSATVSGNREGFVRETELTDQMGFRNPVEESLYRAEQILRESGDELPIVILRPAVMVGDSMTGETEDRGDEVAILVRDNGPGIPAEYRKRIFDRFWRMEGGRQPGTGLGLAIALEIATAHGGRIWVDENPDGGCDFVFEVPDRDALSIEPRSERRASAD